MSSRTLKGRVVWENTRIREKKSVTDLRFPLFGDVVPRFCDCPIFYDVRTLMFLRISFSALLRRATLAIPGTSSSLSVRSFDFALHCSSTLSLSKRPSVRLSDLQNKPLLQNFGVEFVLLRHDSRIGLSFGNAIPTYTFGRA